jgi:hypothetical protein
MVRSRQMLGAGREAIEAMSPLRSAAWMLLSASAAGLLVMAGAKSAWAPMAPDSSFQQGWESGERDQQRQFEMNLQRSLQQQQYENQRALQQQLFEQQRQLQQQAEVQARLRDWEQTRTIRPPSRNAQLNSDVAECGSRANLLVYAWDWPDGSAHLAWAPTTTAASLRVFESCLVDQKGWPNFADWRAGRGPR